MTKETCGAERVMKPLKWKAVCVKPKGHKGPHLRWSATKKWKYEWDDKVE